MIRIAEKMYEASTFVQTVHINTTPAQPVEEGFDASDHIKKEPVVVTAEVIIFEEGDVLHGQWGCETVNGRLTCTEMVGVAPDVGTYEYLVELRDNREIFILDGSDYARDAKMIYPDMTIAKIEQIVLFGGTYKCEVIFVQITKHVIETTELHIQEYDIDGEPHIRWSKTPFEPSNVETAEPEILDMSKQLPGVPRHPRISKECVEGDLIPSLGIIDAVRNWCSWVIDPSEAPQQWGE